MYISGFKFDIEKISDLITQEIENLMTESSIITNNFDTLQNKFSKVTKLKQKYKTQSLDIVFIYENKSNDELLNYDSYKKEISEIYNRINYKMGQSSKIPTFFRSAEGNIPAFHLPAGLNVWFIQMKNFIKTKLNPYIVIGFDVKGLDSYLSSKFNTKESEEFFKEMKYFYVECNEYFSLDKHISENWNKK